LTSESSLQFGADDVNEIQLLEYLNLLWRSVSYTTSLTFDGSLRGWKASGHAIPGVPSKPRL
jgi:hypothetical protein